MTTKPNDTHPIIAMREGVRTLNAHAHATRHQGETGAQQARDAIEALAQLDIENVIGHVRTMVELVGGPRAARRERATSPHAQAAE